MKISIENSEVKSVASAYIYPKHGGSPTQPK